MKTSITPIVSMLRHSRYVALAGIAAAQLLAGELKVDINRTTRNQVTQTEPGYTMWSPVIPAGTGTETTGLAAATQTFTTAAGEMVTISFAQTALSQSRGGTGILSNWFQVGAQGTAKLVSDGITVNPATLGTGGEIKMTITGLLPGAHTLLTYHNAWDNLVAGTQGPIDVYVNGVLAADNVQPTIRAATNNAATVSYVDFTVAATTDVTTILFSAELVTSSARKNPVINGFEIDTPNSTRQAKTPSPANFDEHANADTGSIVLSWTGPTIGTAVSHDVYFGTSETAVRNANHGSPEFKGNQTSLSALAATPDKQAKYYWRIDEIDPLGNVTKGTVWYFRPRQLAFPDAEGYGRFARGGRGGKVVKVTSLADYKSNETPVPGTLRYAIEQETGPRTIVFDVGGLITLQSRLTLNQPYVTVAGQTAPGKGITTRQWPFGLSGARDAIIRFIRNRPGNISGTTIDGGGLAGSDFSIMDHCSISWSIDEAFSSRTAKNITLQRTLISEALDIAGHQNYPPGTAHGYAATIGGDIGSFHHNLLAHNDGRNWSLGGGLDGSGNFAGRLDIVNNVVYNWRTRTTDGGAMEVNFINNYYKPGPASVHFYALTMNHENDAPGSQRAYFTGNVMPGHFDETNQSDGRRSVVSSGVTPPTYETFVNAPFFPSYVQLQSARDAYKRVLSNVGANCPLDDHDHRVIGETLTGTYTYTGTGPFGGYPGLPNTQDDVGGWENYPEVHRDADFDSDGDGLPDWWEQAHGFNVHSASGDFSDANADTDGDGYTNIEDYLNWLANPHYTIGGDAVIDLAQFTRGYTDTPQHSVSSSVNGTVELGADGHTATFHPTSAGLAQFSYTVTDAGGSTMSGVVNFRVLDHPLVTLSDLSHTYDGTPKTATVTTDPAALAVNVTYDGSPTVPTAAGSYAVRATIADLNYLGSASGTLVIAKAGQMMAFSNPGPKTYGDAPFALSATATSGLPVSFSVLNGPATVSGNTVTITGAGSVTLRAVQGGDANYLAAPDVDVSFAVAKAAATIALANLTATYDGQPHAASATTSPVGLNVVLTYDGNSAAAINAGSYAVLAEINDPNYAGTATDTLVIAKAAQTITFPNLASKTYGDAPFALTAFASSGLAPSYSVVSGPATVSGNVVTITGAGSVTLNAAQGGNSNYLAAPNVQVSFTVAKASATLVLGGLSANYDGQAHAATATTNPPNLTVNVTYNGNAAAPTLPGSYTVVATIDDPNYAGTVSDTLRIGVTALVRHAPSLNGHLDGSIQVLTGESFTLNGSTLVSGDLLVRGTPSLQLNGHPTLVGTHDSDGDTAPSNYTVTLNGNAMARYLVRRVNPIAMPAVDAPVAPAGTRSVSLNSPTDNPGDFATIRNLTLNGNVGDVAVPPGAYGQLVANGNSSLVLGHADATEPEVYNLQALVLNNGGLKVVGPVKIVLASGLNVNGGTLTVGDAAHPTWLALALTTGGVTLNGNVTFVGSIVAPNGTVVINGNSALRGSVIADRLTINGNGILDGTP